MARKAASNTPIGETIRRHRVETLKKGLREMAGILNIAPAHLSDIEKSHRNPSEDLLCRICRAYGIDEAELRAGWNKPELIVNEIASQDATAAEKVPALLRTARNLSSHQWDALIQEAQRLASNKEPKGR